MTAPLTPEQMAEVVAYAAERLDKYPKLGLATSRIDRALLQAVAERDALRADLDGARADAARWRAWRQMLVVYADPGDGSQWQPNTAAEYDAAADRLIAEPVTNAARTEAPHGNG